jgi:response regulator RpfG family c-di-GMP phosphodiesterase
MSRIFEPFFSTKFQGRGLGLPAAYGVIENHYGEIFVESSLEKGSKFDIFFPAPEELQENESAADAEKSEDSFVLIIDNDENMQFIIKSILESYGYQIIQARSLVEALSMSKTDKNYKLIFFNSTTVSKEELLIFSYVQSNQPESRTLVLMNYGDTNTKSALSGLNITRIVHQPFDQNELVEVIIETLS